MKRLATVIAVSIGLALLLGSTGTALGARSLPPWAREVLQDNYVDVYDDADAVIVLDEWDISVKDGRRTGTRRWIVHALTEDGVATATLWLFSGSFNRFRKIKAWVREPGGSVESYNDEDGTLLSVSDLRVLDDEEALVIDPPGLRPGAIMAVEHRFVIEADLLQDGFPIQRSIPVWKARIAVESNGDWRVHARVAGGINPGPGVVTDRGLWEFAQVDALERSDAPHAPEPPALQMTLDYQAPSGEPPFPDWNATARWALGLQPLSAAEGPTFIETARRLGEQQGDVVEKVGRVVRRIRYFGVEIGWGAWRPRSAETTLQRGFGDCKDKTHLMVMLLRELGVRSFPVLVIAPEDRYVDDGLPGPFQFNHMVVGIPWEADEVPAGKTVVDCPGIGPIRLFDATLSDTFPGGLWPALEGGAGLALHASVDGLLRIPRSDAESNLRETEYRCKLTDDGSLQARMTRRLTGAMGGEIEDDDGGVKKRDEILREVSEEIFRYHPGFRDLSVIPPRRDPGAWVYDASFTDPDALVDFGALRMMWIHPFRFPSAVPLPDKGDAKTLYLPFRSARRESFELRFDSHRLLTGTESFRVENSLGSVEVTVRPEEHAVLVERTLRITAVEVPPEKREEAKELRQSLRRANSIFLLFESASSPDGEGAPPGASTS